MEDAGQDDAGDRLDDGSTLDAQERWTLLERVRTYQQAATAQVEKLRVQLSRAEDFASTLLAWSCTRPPPEPDGDAYGVRRPSTVGAWRCGEGLPELFHIGGP